jgi:hypothetical protein
MYWFRPIFGYTARYNGKAMIILELAGDPIF